MTPTKITNTFPADDELHICRTDEMIEALISADIGALRKSILLHFVADRAKNDADMHNRISRIAIDAAKQVPMVPAPDKMDEIRNILNELSEDTNQTNLESYLGHPKEIYLSAINRIRAIAFDW